ncbi:MAG: hypothetical protein WED05_10055 [Candidatus Atabeyarchaeum deiterrae]
MSWFRTEADLVATVRELKETRQTVNCSVTGPRGFYKTLALQTIYYHVKDKFSACMCYTLLDLPQEPVDVLLLDDFSSKFYKRRFGTVPNIEFMTALNEVRELTAMIVTTCPDHGDLDLDMRGFFQDNSMLFVGCFELDDSIYILSPAPIEFYESEKKREVEAKRRLWRERVERIKAVAVAKDRGFSERT